MPDEKAGPDAACGGDKGGFIRGRDSGFPGCVSYEGSLNQSRTDDDHIGIVACDYLHI
jgi:hypothetical protein